MEVTRNPGLDLARQVRAGFVLQGSSLGRWCKQHGVLRQNALSALVGSWDGPKGRALRNRIIKAAGLSLREAA
jgi:hypothetical protein